MEQTFLTGVDIISVRHLHNIQIPLSTEGRKHLILTGKNGSGKTSVLEALVNHFQFVISGNYSTRTSFDRWNTRLADGTNGAITTCTSFDDLCTKYGDGNFLIAYYKADRVSKLETSKTIESIELKQLYSLNENPGTKLVKYMVGLKATQAFAVQKNNEQRAKEIEAWFDRFEGILKKVFNDDSVRLDFDIENFQFHILQDNREPFDFNTMSSGYSAVFDIINDLLMRMEKSHSSNMEGIVLIDEIETHLHLELQKIILPFLTELFPNLQFIVTTHSPFILNSIENAVIYDLETRRLVPNGLNNCPYDGIVEGYFDVDRLSKDLEEKFKRYKLLANQAELSDEDWAEVIELETALDEIPDYLSPDLAAEYSRIKLELSQRGE